MEEKHSTLFQISLFQNELIIFRKLLIKSRAKSFSYPIIFSNLCPKLISNRPQRIIFNEQKKINYRTSYGRKTYFNPLFQNELLIFRKLIIKLGAKSFSYPSFFSNLCSNCLLSVCKEVVGKTKCLTVMLLLLKKSKNFLGTFMDVLITTVSYYYRQIPALSIQ